VTLPLLLGDITGFVAFALVGASAVLMAFRARLVRRFGGKDTLRNLHVAVSVSALMFLSLHISLLFSLPVTVPLDLGYGAFALGLVLWLTGVGFLERNRDSFFLHGSLAIAVISLILVHAASSGVNIPTLAALPVIFASGAVALVSAGYNMRKLRTRQR
jgi:hypothetical protein